MNTLPRFLYQIGDNKEILLDAEESKHCLKVLRFKKDDQAVLINGYGKNYLGSLMGEVKGLAKFKIISSQIPVENRPKLCIAVAPTKNTNRFEIFVEKATEFGVGQIFPIYTAHSERPRLNIERLKRIALSAMKQSGRDYIPAIEEMRDWKSLDFFDKFEDRFIAHCKDGEKKELSKIINADKSTMVLIGPEGDFSLQEIEFALSKNFEAVSLGNSRLRTESAALAVSVLYNL